VDTCPCRRLFVVGLDLKARAAYTFHSSCGKPLHQHPDLCSQLTGLHYESGCYYTVQLVRSVYLYPFSGKSWFPRCSDSCWSHQVHDTTASSHPFNASNCILQPFGATSTEARSWMSTQAGSTAARLKLLQYTLRLTHAAKILISVIMAGRFVVRIYLQAAAAARRCFDLQRL
jgi:hypothetical protein